MIYTRLAQGLPARVEDPTVLVLLTDLICHQQANTMTKSERRLILTELHAAVTSLHGHQSSCSFQEVSDS